MKRREFLKTTGTATVALAVTKGTFSQMASPNIEEATVQSLQSMMSGRTVSSQAITQAFLDRIADLDKKLNAVIELNPDALAIAGQMDRERAAGMLRGPFHVIPIFNK
jgi:amidase